MFSKTTLSAAIAVALSMGIGTAAHATVPSDVSFNQCTVPVAGVTKCEPTVTSTVKYAYEQFSADPTTGELSFPFRVLYRPASGDLSKYDFYVNFTLKGGATWGKDGLTTSNFAIEDENGTVLSTSNISIARVTEARDAVTFRVNKGISITTNHLLRFNFTLGNVHTALKTPGGLITLTADFKVAQNTEPTSSANPLADTPTRTVSLASSVPGAEVNLISTNTPTAYINVETDGKTFVGSSAGETAVEYGVVTVQEKKTGIARTSTSAQKGFLESTYDTYWTPTVSKFKLSIDTGNFAASGVPTDGKVYIDLTGGNKLNASTISADKLTATWDYDSTTEPGKTQLPILTTKGTGKIMLTVNGTDSINENRKVAPNGMLSIEYLGGGSISRSATLRHLKRNGTVCTVYNIPNSDALDLVHLRITNDSAGTTGFVKGSLRDMDNKDVFKGKMLVDVGGLAPHQTVHLGMAELTSNGETWGGRGVLTLESNIPEPYMQVYALLRAAGLPDEFPESPLMNLSTGASGNGCD